jgi:hypothetical protein
MTFRVLPEFIIEDVVEFFLFVVRYAFCRFCNMRMGADVLEGTRQRVLACLGRTSL